MWFHVIDDEAEFREIMTALVISEGYKAASFKSAEIYMDFFTSPQYIKPVAIIMDNRMSGMNGIELVKCIRKRAPFQRIVITTATLEDIEMVRSELCYELPKPFKYEQLKTMLGGLVACSKTHGDDFICFENGICMFGLEHICPFAISE